MSTLSARTPRSSSRNRRTLARSSPAAVTRTNASATCDTTSNDRSRACDRPPVDDRVSPRSVSFGSEPASAQRRRESAQHGADRRDRDRECENARIERQSGEPRNRSAAQRDDAAHRHARHGETREVPRHREHQTLHEQLTDEARPARAQRAAQRELALALRPAHEQQVGHVHAHEQEHRHRRPEHQLQRSARLADDVFLERREARAEVLRAGILVRQLRAECVELGLRAGDRHAGPQPADDRDVVIARVARVSGRLPCPSESTRRRRRQ